MEWVWGIWERIWRAALAALDQHNQHDQLDWSMAVNGLARWLVRARQARR